MTSAVDRCLADAAGRPISSLSSAVMRSRSFVAAFRRWLVAGGGGGPAWPKGMPRELPPRQRSREALLNRYEAHTKNCPTCLAVSCAAPG